MIHIKNIFTRRPSHLVMYLLKFVAIFCICYFGTRAVIGLAASGRHYISFVHEYLDYVSWIKDSLIAATAWILSLFGIHTHAEPGFALRINGGKAIIIAMSCVGYGVYSFWIAFVAANKGGLAKKLAWIAAGLLLLWLINVIRITLFLVAINKGWPMPLGIDHHTWFTIVAYAMIFLLIMLYDRSFRGHKINAT
jgi:exosortase/archaeosortase family protein